MVQKMNCLIKQLNDLCLYIHTLLYHLYNVSTTWAYQLYVGGRHLNAREIKVVWISKYFIWNYLSAVVYFLQICLKMKLLFLSFFKVVRKKWRKYYGQRSERHRWMLSWTSLDIAYNEIITRFYVIVIEYACGLLLKYNPQHGGGMSECISVNGLREHSINNL